MSQFYADIQGNRGEATRTGHKRSGIRGHLRGWNKGVKVVGFYDEKKKEDKFIISKTGGSNGAIPEEIIAEV